MWKLYDVMLENLPDCGKITSLISGEVWNLARTESGGCGLAMTTVGSSISPVRDSLESLQASQAAQAVKSWNLEEASGGMAAINACYNTPERLEALAAYEPFEYYCTRGLDFTGKTVGIVGHMHMPQELRRLAGAVYTLEKRPQPGDYPDSACEYILPRCDIVLITGSSLVNKTLPRLLELSARAYTIVTGPTVPMCPQLLELNIQRLAGLVVTDRETITAHVADGRSGNPYPMGKPFLLQEGRL